MIIELQNKSDFESTISSGNVVVDFNAVWCPPCRMMGEIIHQIEEDYPSITFLKVDVDKFPALANQYKISSIPNMIFYKDGNRIDVNEDGDEIESLLGARPQDAFEQILKDTFGI